MFYRRRVLIVVAVVYCVWIAGCSFFTRKPSYPEPPPASYRIVHFAVTGISLPEQIQAAEVTPDFFATTKALPLYGRLFQPEDYQGKTPTVLLSHRFWQRSFRADPSVIGKTVGMDGKRVTILGIMPSTFDLPPGTDVWRP